ncbi:MAG TPA: hypothetical protein VES42_05675, partial [Pilimelia sp.]|nr:hypothetical protein [Pilimelia sp.]
AGLAAANGVFPGWPTGGDRGPLSGAQPAPTPGPGGTPSAGTTAAPSPTPSATVPAAVGDDEVAAAPRRTRPAGPRLPPIPPVRVGATVYGPLLCTETVWDIGHPALATPCHATGPGIRLLAQMEALPGVHADISISLLEAETEKVVAGPFTCGGRMFTDYQRIHKCGPFTVLDAPRGARSRAQQNGRYTARPLLPGGMAYGESFRW